MSGTLAEELATFERMRGSLLAAHEGRYAVVVGNELLGVFDNADAAYTAGRYRCGPDRAFLLRLVTRTDDPLELPALAFGLIDSKVP